MAAHVPGIAAARRDRRRVRHVRLVIAGRRHFATRRHVQQVAREVIAPRAGLAEWGQRADQPGVVFPQRFVSEPDRGQEAGPEGFDDDIRRRRQAAEQRAAIGGLKAQRDAALRGVVVPERQAALGMRHVVDKRPDMAARLAARRLDLDHVGPEIAEQFAAELARLVRQLQHPQAGQRARQVPDRPRSPQHLLHVGEARAAWAARTCRRQIRREARHGRSRAGPRRCPSCAGRSAGSAGD